MKVEPVKLKSGGIELVAMFNPASLKVTLTNKIQDEESGSSGNKAKSGGKGKAKQHTRATNAKLTTELLFDTTETGDDVRSGPNGTLVLSGFATAPEGDHPVPPTVELRWGKFSFTGVIESLDETFDFWSSEGVPLRSTVQISMVETQFVKPSDFAKAALPKARPQAVTPVPAGSSGTSAAAARQGNANGGRALAAANGIENMRMTGGGMVAVSAQVELRAAASFTISAGASAGASAGFGIGAGAGAGAGASAGIGGSASVGISASAGFGASATAGVGATAGAFAGLGQSKTRAVAFPLDPLAALPTPTPGSSGSALRVDVTGKVQSDGSSGLRAQVSGQASAGVNFS